MRFGHHFYNWDRTWDNDLDLRLRLTRDTGWEGFEAKPKEFGVPAEELRARCEQLGLTCAAVGGGVEEAIDYAALSEPRLLGVDPPENDWKRWVDYAGERSVEIVIHPHVGGGGRGTGGMETREDLLRYLDACPGIFACPDTGHLLLCGSDPIQTIRDLGERCRYVHLKDIDMNMAAQPGMKGKCFRELGTGDLDLAGVMGALEEIGFDGWIMVERDERVDDYAASARNMREVLRGMGN